MEVESFRNGQPGNNSDEFITNILNSFIFEMSEKLSKSHETCKTCRKEIGNNDTTFYCIACGVFMHLTTPCTGITKEGINGILEIGQNIMLLCNDCVARNRRDDVMDSLINTRRQPELTAKITFLDEKIAELNKTIAEIKVGFEKKDTPKIQPPPKTNPKLSYDGIRIRGLPESKALTPRARHENDMEEVNKVFGFLNVDCEISDLRRLGSYEEAKTSGKNRTIIVDLANPWQKRIIFLSLYKLKDYGKPVYISRELNPDEITIENELLKQRRDLINKGIACKRPQSEQSQATEA